MGAFAHGRRIRLPAHAVHRLHRGYVDQRLRPGALDAKLHADRCRRPRIRPRRDAVGDDRPAEPFGDRPLVGGRRACRRHRRCRAPDGQAAQDPCGKPYRDGRTPRGLQRHRLQPPRQHDALYRNDARHAARRHADAGGSGAAGHSFPERVPFRADADGGCELRGVRRCSKFRPTALRLPCVPLSNGNRPAGNASQGACGTGFAVYGCKTLFSLWRAQPKHKRKTSIR